MRSSSSDDEWSRKIGEELTERSLDGNQEKIEDAAKRAEATTSTMIRKIVTKVQSDVRDPAEERKILR